MKQYKKLSKNIITFQEGDDNEALLLAKMGMSNRCIMERTKHRLSNNQITYRLHKAKDAEGNHSGYRVAFRNGWSPLALKMIRDLHAVVQADIQAHVVPKITKPTPETVKIKGAK